MEQHNIEKEKRIIELLGYYLEGPDSFNYWTIWNNDRKETKYGYIRYKKLHGANKKEGTSKAFGYYMNIKSPNVNLSHAREENSNASSTYKLEITNETRADVDYVHLTLGSHPSIIIRSAKYGYIDFHIDCNGLHLLLSSITDNYKVEEVLHFQNINDPTKRFKKRYSYYIGYCKKEHELSDTNSKWRTSREIKGEQIEADQLKVNIQTWVHGHQRLNEDYYVLGTVEEMARRQQMGIDTLNCFRCILNKIFLGQEDVLSKIVNEEMIETMGLSVLFDGYEEPQKRAKL